MPPDKSGVPPNGQPSQSNSQPQQATRPESPPPFSFRSLWPSDPQRAATRRSDIAAIALLAIQALSGQADAAATLQLLTDGAAQHDRLGEGASQLTLPESAWQLSSTASPDGSGGFVNTLRLPAALGEEGVRATAMADCGATALFMDTAVARRCGAEIRPTNRYIRLANGAECKADGVATVRCHLTSAAHDGVAFVAEFCVAPLGGHEVILGTPWFAHFNPQIDWRERRLRFQRGHGYGLHTADGRSAEGAEFVALRAIGSEEEREPERAPPPKVDCAEASHTQMRNWFRRGHLDLSSVELIRVRPTPDVSLSAASEVDAPKDPALRALLSKYADVMPDELPAGIAKDRAIKHHIELTPGSRPHAPPLRRYSPAEDAEIRKQVEAQLARGHVRPSTSPWGAMVLLAKKKDGSMRFCVDYRALNNQTVKDRYALPLADECFDRAQGARFFSKIDLFSGFWQIQMGEGSAALTAFRTRFGHFEYTVLPMGLCNAPATFMRLMNDVLRKHLDQFVLAFLDDIFIYSKTREEHLQHLEEVLKILREHKLYLKPSKCEWMKAEVEFLGHRIGREGLSVDPGKVDAIKTWPVPTDASALRSFLGLAGYYRRFIEDYSRIALPLTELTKDEAEWAWAEKEQAAFEQLQRLLSSAPVLQLADPALPYTLHCDASGYAVGSVLMQDQGSGLQPVSFISTKMKDAETRYAPHEQELLALVYACKKWRHYLHGRPFTILSDHRSLQHFSTQPLLSARQARWKDALAEFDFTIQYIEGPKNVVADALSRRADHRPASSLQEILQQKGAVAKSSSDFLATIQIVSEKEASVPCQACAASARDEGSSGPDAEAMRQRAKASAERSAPPHPDLPRPNKQGVIVMPSQRCTAEKKGGGQCRARTGKGQYCFCHRKLLCGTRIARSPVAGHGLVATREFRPKQGITDYTGDLRKLGPDDGGPYYLELRDGIGVDAARTNAGDGRWVNDPRGTGLRANAHLGPQRDGKGMAGRIIADRKIRPGQEILVRYGQRYWNAVERAQQALAEQRAARTAAKGDRRSSAVVTAAAATTMASDFTLLEGLRTAAASDATYPKDLESARRTYGEACELRGGLAWIREQLCVPNDAALRTTLVSEFHDTPQGGHFGRDKTLAALRQRFHWAGMQAQVAEYVATCDTCQRVKHSRRRTPGLLMPLPIPEEIDSHWTMDFVSGLPKTERGFDVIQGHFSRGGSIKRLAAACTTDGASEIAQRFVDSVVRHHGVPASIVSDRDPRLIKGFWRALQKRLGTSIHASSSHHPETDGKSERDQQTMEQYLQSFAEENPKDWDLQLGLCELALNSTPHATTGLSAYKLLYGREPATSVDRALHGDAAALAQTSDDTVVPAAEARWEQMRSTWQHARIALLKGIERMKAQADKQRRDLRFSVGDMVMLSTKHLQLRDESSTRKLTPLYCGPFPVKKVVNDNAYELALPPLFKIHPVINVSQLRQYRDGRAAFPTRPQALPRPPPDAIDSNGEEQYVVERILGHKGTGAALRYLVLWQGYPFEEATWQTAADLKGAAEALARYRRDQAELPQRARARRGGKRVRRARGLAAAASRGYTPPPVDLTTQGIAEAMPVD
jgi:RNase H-like domain found in reverse transcriptase/Reverse transcriptase (RNA-dependent DNA polymerase)/Integrase zinc binding domain/Chromo (CHRromatin Organisation MOdifier) domain